MTTVVHLLLGLAEPARFTGPGFVVTDPQLFKSGPDGEPLGARPAPFDVVVEVRLVGEPPEWTSVAEKAVRSALDRAGVVDPTRSALVAGCELRVIEGEGAAFSAGLIRRRADVAAAEFTVRWRDRHATFARRVSGAVGYRQIHAVPEFCRAAAGATGITVSDFDGLGMMFAADLRTLGFVRSSPEVGLDATKDEMTFADHTRSHFFAAVVR